MSTTLIHHASLISFSPLRFEMFTSLSMCLDLDSSIANDEKQPFSINFLKFLQERISCN